MIIVKDYSVYGDNNQYRGFTFETEAGYNIKITLYNDGTNNIECEGVTFEEIEKAKRMFEKLLKIIDDLEELK